ncbi:Glycosyl-hydrolase 97 C-terminal, oligomerisation [Mucilaginibacter pineti]|uniref:Glycosyl-hydrolase 97 C-terminal, oligomerisation n=1 Tax=Mucilaginibacter pineti TaxID=1391627 RepID=A0A1G7DBM3_9SPHI|nr:glycoside hydrolase family 97 protein [Mucilaginibacter pineti]SDE48145.1 Glycosyl-hydrolase 97 C-terminal, oligomerisation [Mucilaginibacter pineti]
MKKVYIYLLSCTLSVSALAQDKNITASQGKVKLEFTTDAQGHPQYSVSFNQQAIVKPSRLGIKLLNDTGFDEHLQVINTETINVDELWKPVWGEVSVIRNHYQQLTVHLKQQDAPGRLLDIIFRVFDDGVGFRYEFPKQPNLRYFTVTDELTQFALTGDHKTFWIPGDYDSNEYSYTTSKLSEVDAWVPYKAATDIAVRVVPDQYAVQTPLMMKTAGGLYINIHEAALVNYTSMQLHVDRASYTLSANLVPDAVGNKAYMAAPCKTPWRTIIVSDRAADILSSKLILNLNEPSKIQDPSYIKPMKFVGVWWEMQTGKSTWNYANSINDVDASGALKPSGKHGANTANVKHYIDFAAKNGIGGVLVEGWNRGWEEWFGNWTEHVFDFATPYPDFDVKELSSYAAQKGVKMIMHNETSGSATDYERQMDTAFRFMNKFGYPAVKTGYVGKIIPRGEHHDGQWMVEHYIRVAQKSADHQVMLDAHEPVRPTGLSRTYPNWMASEAGRGNEYNAFSNGNNPEHETIMPFTRLMGGPMDYTPGIFKLKGYAAGVPDRQVHTTLAKQLALYVTMYSPLQMAADLTENYEQHMDAFQFIKDVAVDWDDTKIIEAEPGDYVTIARKEKGAANWFIGSVTDENGRKAVIPLSFLDKGKKYIATIYADADNADWKINPEAYQIHTYLVNAGTKLNITLAKGGGAAISIKPATSNVKGLKMYK